MSDDAVLSPITEAELKFAARVWQKLPTSTRRHIAEWLAIVYRGQICARIRRNGHCHDCGPLSSPPKEAP